MTLNIYFLLRNKAKFDKKYEGDEESMRFEIYKKSLAEVEEHNKKFEAGLETYAKGMNNFSDWTEEESNNLHGVIQP